MYPLAPFYKALLSMGGSIRGLFLLVKGYCGNRDIMKPGFDSGR